MKSSGVLKSWRKGDKLCQSMNTSVRTVGRNLKFAKLLVKMVLA